MDISNITTIVPSKDLEIFNTVNLINDHKILKETNFIVISKENDLQLLKFGDLEHYENSFVEQISKDLRICEFLNEFKLIKTNIVDDIVKVHNNLDSKIKGEAYNATTKFNDFNKLIDALELQYANINQKMSTIVQLINQAKTLYQKYKDNYQTEFDKTGLKQEIDNLNNIISDAEIQKMVKDKYCKITEIIPNMQNQIESLIYKNLSDGFNKFKECTELLKTKRDETINPNELLNLINGPFILNMKNQIADLRKLLVNNTYYKNVMNYLTSLIKVNLMNLLIEEMKQIQIYNHIR